MFWRRLLRRVNLRMSPQRAVGRILSVVRKMMNLKMKSASGYSALGVLLLAKRRWCRTRLIVAVFEQWNNPGSEKSGDKKEPKLCWMRMIP